MRNPMTRDELIRYIAEIVEGLQVPISMSMPLGTADAPIRELMNLNHGWATIAEREETIREILDA